MLYRFLKKKITDSIYTRADDTGAVFYFTADDFPGLQKTAYPVKSSRGHQLDGYFYFYDGYRDDRIVVFEHGMGSGHTGYMKEIERLCAHGYRVYAYDHTGCMNSGGCDTGGFVQSLIDCNDVIGALQADPAYAALPISVIGHSWGGLSTVNIASLHPEVTHLIALAPPISPAQLIENMLPPMLSRYAKKFSAEERAKNPDFYDRDARESLWKTAAHVLILHSADDPVVRTEYHFKLLRDALSDRPNTRFVLLSNKAHNPNYTADAVKYKDEFFAQYQTAIKNKQLVTEAQKTTFKNSYDWNRMTVQDDDVWAMIFETLDKPVSTEDSHAD
ncbi:MAG: alpha/beta hydrolase [Clostridia bacterium]|nr:alpha/beta hydrolase [Clostridia bacterium]